MRNFSGKQFFLISFLPAIAYWYLEARYPLKVALAGGFLLALLEIILEKIFTKHVHALSKFNFFLIIFLGAISFGEEDGMWFKLQPCFTGLGIGGYLLVRLYKGKSLMNEMMASMGKEFPFEGVMEKIEVHMGIFFIAYGLFMAGIALLGSTGSWLFFKTAGFYLATFLFLSMEFFYMRLLIRRIVRNQQKAEVLRRFNITSS